MAYYQTLEWHERIGGGPAGTPAPPRKLVPPSYPLISSHILWCFTLNYHPGQWYPIDIRPM
jgi:hypothetical protein